MMTTRVIKWLFFTCPVSKPKHSNLHDAGGNGGGRGGENVGEVIGADKNQ